MRSTPAAVLFCSCILLLFRTAPAHAAAEGTALVPELELLETSRLPRDPRLPRPAGSIVPVAPSNRGGEVLRDMPFAPAQGPAAGGVPVEQVIVTSESLAEAFRALADRETAHGIPTVVRTTKWIDAAYPGADAPARIRAFLRDARDRWGTRWVVLGGDVEHVPVRYVPYFDTTIPTDLYYECVDREWNEDGDAAFAEPMTAANLEGFVNDVAQGADGRIWAAMNVGLVVLDGERFELFTTRDGLPSDVVRDVDVAADGSVWAGTSLGVARLGVGGKWSAHGRAAGLPGDDVLRILARAGDDVWAGTSEGLAHWDGEEWFSFLVADGLPSNTVTALAHDGTRLWVGTLRGAASFEGGVFRVHDESNSGILSNHVISIAVDPSGSVWFGHLGSYFRDGGISRFDGSAWLTDALRSWSGPSVRAIVLGAGPGELWAATPAGLLHRSGGVDEMLSQGDGLAGTDVQSVTRGLDGGLLVAGAEGLSVGSPGGWTVFTADRLPRPPLAYDDVDLVPDLVAGRIPATDPAEVDAYLAKLFAYQDGFTTDRVESALLMGEIVFSGSDGKDVCVEASRHFPAAFETTGLYEVDGTEDVGAVLTELDRGHGIVLHVGHGSYDILAVGPGPDRGLLFNSQIDRISPAGRAGFVLGYNCSSGGFDQDCSMEHLLFHPTAGAVATCANTRASMLYLDATANDALLQDLFTSTHGNPALAFHASRARVLADYPEEMRLLTWWRHHYLARSFLGTPTLAVWRRAPQELAVTHPAVLPAARTELPVTVRDAAAGTAVPGALVCLSKGGEDYAYGRTDALGTVRFEFRPERPGPLRVVVTAPDFRPYDGTATVAAGTGPNLVATAWRRIDSRAADAWQVQFALRNTGLPTGGATLLSLQSADPRVVVVRGLGKLVGVAAGDTAWTTPFELAAAQPLADGESFAVLLTGTGGATFAETFRLTAASARLELAGVVVEGEELRLRVVNRGTAPTGNVTATLRALDDRGEVIEGEVTAASLRPGETRVLAEGFRVAGDTGVPFELLLDDGAGRVLRQAIDREPPAGPSRPAAEPAEGGALVSWTPSESPDLAGYRVLTGRPGSPWIDEPGSLLTSGSRILVSLPAGASRSLSIVAVDSSGHASPDSCFVTAYAARPSLPGWPQRVTSVIGPSAIVAVDLDSDGKQEILHGSLWDANAAHAFRADGSEWTDGDADAATNGIFGKTGGRVVSTPLAIDVDGDGAKEIFTGSYDGRLHAWRTGGARGSSPEALAGFPVIVSPSALRSSPVAADLDGDGAPEIVVVASYREVHAFEADGTPVPGWPRVTGASGLHTTPAVHDLDLDGGDDVIFGGNTDGVIYAVSGDGSDLPGWPANVGAPARSSPVLADVGGDSRPEVFAVTDDGMLHGLDGSGRALPGWPVQLAAPLSGSNVSPAVADLDRDGQPEIVVAGHGAITVVRGDGSALPGTPIQIGASAESSPVIADVDADGTFEILLGTSDRRVHAFALDGVDAPGWPLTLTEVSTAEPFVADVDGDGFLDVAIGANDAWVRVLRLETPVAPGAAPWPGYHGGSRLDGVYRHVPYHVAAAGPLAGSPVVSPTLRFEGAWPNPFRERTELRLVLPQPGPVHLDILDVRGRRVATLLDGAVVPAGPTTVTWGGRDTHHAPVASGVYFVRLRSGGEVRTAKLLRLR